MVAANYFLPTTHFYHLPIREALPKITDYASQFSAILL